MRAALIIFVLAAVAGGCAELRDAPVTHESDAPPNASVQNPHGPDAGVTNSKGSSPSHPGSATNSTPTDAAIARLLLATRTNRNDLGESYSVEVENRLVVLARAAETVAAEPTAELTPCELWISSPFDGDPPPPTAPPLDLDLGTVSVTSDTLGADVFRRANDANGPAYVSSHGTAVPFLGGDTLTFDATGSAAFREGHMTMTMPQPVPLDVLPTFTPGANYDVRWAGQMGGTNVTLTIRTWSDAEIATVVCTVPDAGEYVVPPYVTERLFPATPTAVGQVTIERTYRTNVELPDTSPLYEWQATTFDVRPMSPD